MDRVSGAWKAPREELAASLLSWLMEARGILGTVSFDGVWVTISRRGLRAFLANKVGEKRLAITSVTGIHWRDPAVAQGPGFIQFTLPGGIEAQGPRAAWKDENSMVFNRAQMPAFVGLRVAVEMAIGGRESLNATESGPVFTAADEILKFAELRDRGIISQQEFEAKKTELLGP